MSGLCSGYRSGASPGARPGYGFYLVFGRRGDVRVPIPGGVRGSGGMSGHQSRGLSGVPGFSPGGLLTKSWGAGAMSGLSV